MTDDLRLGSLSSDSFSLDYNQPGDVDEALSDETPNVNEGLRSRCKRNVTKHLYRRAFSESKLLDILDRDLVEGATYHCISNGDIDSLSYLKCIVRQQNLHYVLFSTWCMAIEDVFQMREWVESGKIGRIDAYCGEIFPSSYSAVYAELKKVVDLCGGRVAIFRNHAKIYAGVGDRFAFGIESSANINTNPRVENTTITVSRDTFEFYKEFFDGIKSLTKDYAGWVKWSPEDGAAYKG